MRRVHPLLWLAFGGLVTGLHAAALQAGWATPTASAAGRASPANQPGQASSAPLPVSLLARSPSKSPPQPEREPATRPVTQTQARPPSTAPLDTTEHSPLEITPSAGIPTETVYLPRSALTRPPRPLAPIEVPYPDTAPLGHWRVQLSLFIDAEGQVRQVRVDAAAPGSVSGTDTFGTEPASPLPAPLADSARQAFLQARFAPGEQEGLAVASLLRIEVEFRAQPLPDAAAASIARPSEAPMEKGGPAPADPPLDRPLPISST